MDGLLPVLLIILVICCSLAAIFSAFRIFGRRTLLVASEAYEWVSKFGIAGKAAYVGCWIFMFPFALGICVAGGILVWLGEQREHGATDGVSSTSPE